MAQASQSESSITPRTIGAGYLFGVPLGDLGWFSSLLMGLAAGMAAFFASTFCAIIAVLFYNSTTHHTLDYALTYKHVGLPVGLFIMVAALGYLGTLRIKRLLRRS
jgi:ABC-type dipeptide/oligopeptide/nickel transport system permease subunit